jgi:DNA-directed RNA polymerase specialized sigma24 family protein
VNEAFQCWVSTHQVDAKQNVDLWTYCYVRRYYLLKFVREAAFQSSDFDELVTTTYRKIERFVAQVEQPDRYAQWVSKICKNTFINYGRAGRRLVALDGAAYGFAEETTVTGIDTALWYKELAGAVGRLPEFLQSVAMLRFVERRSYEEIERVTGKPLPVIRSYTSKALARFRQDSRLKAAIEPLYENIVGR